jgi:hypothetical protein
MALTAWKLSYNSAVQPQPVKRATKFSITQAAVRPTTGQLWPRPKT